MTSPKQPGSRPLAGPDRDRTPAAVEAGPLTCDDAASGARFPKPCVVGSTPTWGAPGNQNQQGECAGHAPTVESLPLTAVDPTWLPYAGQPRGSLRRRDHHRLCVHLVAVPAPLDLYPTS